MKEFKFRKGKYLTISQIEDVQINVNGYTEVKYL